MAFEIPPGLMVSVSGVRGRVGDALTPGVVTRFAAAFGAWVRESSGAGAGEGRRAEEARGDGGSGGPTVVVARDARTSGPMFRRAVTAALQSVGCDVVDLGLVPTPTALLAVRHHGAGGAVIITASHNPVEWNALKLASGSGMFLDAGEARRMREFVEERPIPYAAWDGLGAVARDDDALDRHLEAVLDLPFVDVEALRERGFRVALDCTRGAGAVLLPRLLDSLGCDVHGIELEPDGRFTREPEPVAENLGALERRVREVDADIGLATDPDGDRLSLVDDTGRAVGEDLTLALASTLVLRHRSGPVVTNLSTSRVLDDVAADAGVPLKRAPVGEINVARRMQSEDAVIGGEGNGGVILPDLQMTRDAAVASALVLQLLLETGETMEQLVAALPGYAIVKDKLPRGDGSLEPVYDALETQLDAPGADEQDGLRLDWPADRKWLHVRPSGTEPILRVIAEAPSEAAARELVEQAKRTLRDARRAAD